VQRRGKFDSISNSGPVRFWYDVGVSGNELIMKNLLALIASLFFFACTAFADEVAVDVQEVYLYQQRVNKVEQFDLRNSKPKSFFDVEPIHVKGAPKSVKRRHGGILFEDILKKSFKIKKFGQNRVTFIAHNSYVVELPLVDAFSAKAMLNLEKDGVRESWKEGFPNIIFPLNQGQTQYLSDPTWWVWWTSAVVLGAPHFQLQFQSKQIDLEKCKGKDIRVLSYPRGRRQPLAWKDKKVELRFCTLEEFEGFLGLASKAPVAWKNLMGSTVEVNSKDYVLVFAKEKERIPISMGGPFQLCRKNLSSDCHYFISSLHGEKVSIHEN
jgi:hypothetical protein